MTRTALVTGGNRGLGQETCRQLAKKGLRVLLGARDEALGKQAALELDQQHGVQATPVVVDVASPDSIRALIQRLDAEDTDVDVLVNNAGIYENGDLLATTVEALERSMAVHVTGPLLLTQALLPGMVERGFGRIVNVSSGLGSFAEGLNGAAAYSISKAALNALTVKSAAAAGKAPNVKVNAVCPGWARTRMGGPNADRSVEKGADGIVWAATLPDDAPTGGFFRDCKPIAW